MQKIFDFTDQNILTKNKEISVSIFVYLWIIFSCLSANAQTLAPGAPGKDAQWATAGKQAVGTSVTLESKVWFTLAQGVMTEVYYPDVTVANVHLLQFVVVDPKTRKVETEQDDAVHEIKVLRSDSPTFQQINTAKSGAWKITKTYATLPNGNSVWVDVRFETKSKELQLYVFYDPSLKNSGMHDTASVLQAERKIVSTTYDLVTEKTDEKVAAQKVDKTKNVTEGLFASDGDIASLLLFTSEIADATSGFLGTSDGFEQLRSKGKLTELYTSAKDGNVVQMARIVNPKRFTMTLAFGKDAADAFKQINPAQEKELDFNAVLTKYEKGWSDYVKTLRKIEPKYQAQFNMAAMQLKMLEDKTVRGANIASLTVPWGGGDNANENNIGGYHLIWSRDLYQVATAFMALGDKDAPIRALDFLFRVQQKPDGSFPQNSYLDGKPFWGSLQLDEVAFPLILAYQLNKNDKATWENHVKRAADFIVKNGPVTPQERWEEEGGYSPSTIAAEIAGLVCAAEIAKKNGDAESANLYLKTADEWRENIEKWTVTTTGKYSKEPYYVRITQNGKPDAGEKIELNNGAGFFDEREIVDAGFLELVRLGIKSPDDKIIQNSLKVIDEVIRVQTPNGDAFYRYNNDGYGEMEDGRRWNWDGKYTGKGRLWALLSGERGQYEIARHNFDYPNKKAVLDNGTYLIKNENGGSRKGEYLFDLNSAVVRLDSMAKFANDGLMIPEQIWDSPKIPKNADRQFVPELKFGEGTGSATPLAWSMAQFIRLAVNLQEGKNLDTPDVVYNRYVLGRKKTETISTSISDANGFQTKLPRENPVSNLVKIESPLIANCQKKLGIKTCDGSKEMHACISYAEDFKKLEIAGDFTDWKPKKLNAKKKGDKTQIDCLTFAKKARVEYKLIVDGKWMTDPLNPNKVDNGVGGENSYFEMPDYKPTNWDSDKIQPVIKDIAALDIESKKFGKRTVKIYLPSEYYKRGVAPKMPVLYVQDGSEYISRAKAINVLENLIAAKKVEPFMIVFVDPKDRMKEYFANDDWADFMALEVVPAVEKKYFSAIKTGRENRALLGASLGGITSVHAALKHPEIFGRVGGQSSSFWVDSERVVKELEKLDASKTKYRFYFDDGTLEGVEDSQKVVKILKDKGFDVTYAEAEAGHNWTAWRDRLADAFIALWK